MIRITLFSGRQVECTENHPLLTVDGWVEAGDLKEGDSLAVVRHTPIPDSEPLPAGFASLIGYLIGDGGFSRGVPLITASDPEVVEHLRSIAGYHDWKLSETGRYGYYLGKASGKFGNKNGKSAKEVLRRYLKPAKSVDKRVPECIWKACGSDLRDFLAAYFNCDGTVTTCREGVAEYYSTSEGLLRDIQCLLTRLGVYSSLRPKLGRYKGEAHHSWRLTIAGRDLVLFSDAVPAIGKRGQKLRDAAEANRGQRAFPQYESIPPGWKKLSTRGIGWHRGHSGIRADKNYSRGTARHIVSAIAEIEDNEPLRRLCDPDVIWERIERIEAIGDRPTFDVEVDGEHNFVTDGIIVHNSSIISQYFPAWYLGRFPDKRVILTSSEADFAAGWGRKVRDILSEFGPEYFGVRVRPDSSAANRWDLAEHLGGMVTAGIGGQITGRGADIFLCDDPIKNAEEAASETIRARNKDWWRSTAYTRLEPGGSAVIICTRWHHDDLAGWLIAGGAGDEDGGGGASSWEVLNLPALAEDGDPLGRAPGDALWPERYDRAALEEIRKSANVGEYFFAAMFQGRPVPRTGGMFRREWFPVVAAAPAEATRIRFWDMASSPTGDYSAGVRMARVNPGIYYVEDVVRGRWTPHERDQVILQTAQIDGRSVGVRVEQEPGSAGVSVVAATVKLLAGFAIRGERPTGDKVTRAGPFASQCEAGNVRLVAGGWIREFLEEVELFPFAKHDDQVDGCSGCFNELALAPAPRRLVTAPNPLSGYRG